MPVSGARSATCPCGCGRADDGVRVRRVLESLQGEARAGGLAAGGVATGLAAVDRYDTYVALVT